MLGRRSFLAGLAGLASLVSLPRAPRAAVLEAPPAAAPVDPRSLLVNAVKVTTATVELEDGRAVLEHRLGVVPFVTWSLEGAAKDVVSWLAEVDQARVVVLAVASSSPSPARGTVKFALW